MDTPNRPTDAEDSHTTKGLLRLTMACNERCPFCNVPVEDYARPTPPMAETEADLARFIESGEQTLTISGGEPTLLRKRLLSVIKTARDGGIPFVEVQTNAVLVDDAYAQALSQAGLTSAFVSLLSDVAEHHDFLAGLEGAFGDCLRGIDAMLDAGIRVTLNPVTARQTQDRVQDYVDFVATRLPRVRSISMSAVQPHGRAQHDLDLLPDYDQLATAIRLARGRAERHGITLLNPYCGLPLCVGWEDDLDHSVEAIEARQGPTEGVPGVDNRGNKSHGKPCIGCALRPRCGGAWHAYWHHRGGAGLEAPISIVHPWDAGTASHAGQTVVRAEGRPTAEHWAQLKDANTPTLWLWADEFESSDAAATLRSACTDLAIDINLADPQGSRQRLAALRALVRAGQLRRSQARIQVHLRWLVIDPTAQRIADGVDLARGIGAASLTLSGLSEPATRTWAERAAGRAPDLVLRIP
jgi:MoaA/NifB/PqqE/SkfB family radical SAM enzyme